ncbi:MAG: hypothetical protein H0A76_05750 [Candidatus Thiodubiliella endoseptemdiera]|uniref:Uncharacterized protein n=1 Tax=Candidatus Thiodubiliella endoseptemdiera TaxID=2738886 RepID=A0A853F198_9GAMM|nr:hypothetical protein [Candidatus Thiodubiliella endoseptemdiera]
MVVGSRINPKISKSGTSNPAYEVKTGGNNPFNGIDVGGYSPPNPSRY